MLIINIIKRLDMKNILFKLMICACIGLWTGCSDDDPISSVVVDGPKPISGFTYTKDFLEVAFTNTSKDAESYYWDFGDGTFSTEESPKHTYAASGNYDVVLKVNSSAGYSDKSEPVSFYVAGEAKAFFTFTPGYGRNVDFDATGSVNAKSATWDFGDGSPAVEGFTVSHNFASDATFEVTVTIKGLTDDIATYTNPVIVKGDFNLLKGSDMEASSAQFWSLAGGASNPAANPLTYRFGYTDDKPSGGSGACFVFDHYANGGAGPRLYIYQAVDVVAGEEYLFGAQVKLPAGAKSSALRFYIVQEDQLDEKGEPEFNKGERMYYEFSTWSKWGNENNGTGANINKSFAYDGDLKADFIGGLARYSSGGTYGIYTATKTGKVFVGFSNYVSWADSGGAWLIDDVRFEPVNP